MRPGRTGSVELRESVREFVSARPRRQHLVDEPLVGPTGQELVDQVALRTHDLHPVISGFAGQQGAAGIFADGLLDPSAAQGPRAELADGRLAFGRGHAERVVAVPTTVEDLQGNPNAGRVDGLGDLPDAWPPGWTS